MIFLVLGLTTLSSCLHMIQLYLYPPWNLLAKSLMAWELTWWCLTLCPSPLQSHSIAVQVLILAGLHLSWCYSIGVVNWMWVGLLHMLVLPVKGLQHVVWSLLVLELVGVVVVLGHGGSSPKHF